MQGRKRKGGEEIKKDQEKPRERAREKNCDCKRKREKERVRAINGEQDEA